MVSLLIFFFFYLAHRADNLPVLPTVCARHGQRLWEGGGLGDRWEGTEV